MYASFRFLKVKNFSPVRLPKEQHVHPFTTFTDVETVPKKPCIRADRSRASTDSTIRAENFPTATVSNLEDPRTAQTRALSSLPTSTDVLESDSAEDTDDRRPLVPGIIIR